MEPNKILYIHVIGLVLLISNITLWMIPSQKAKMKHFMNDSGVEYSNFSGLICCFFWFYFVLVYFPIVLFPKIILWYIFILKQFEKIVIKDTWEVFILIGILALIIRPNKRSQNNV